ncbi:MAG: NAD-dependent epimerase/dehydratase family protein [Candidatus Odinarchaeota archaeon]
MKKLLITGGTGFLGSWLLEVMESSEFREELTHDTVRLLVRDPAKARGLKSDVFNYEIVQGNLFDHESLHKATEGVDAVIHIAALFDITSKWSDFKKANLEGTRVLIEALNPGSTFILTSSAAYYGLPSTGEKITEEYRGKTFGHYQKSKQMQEDLARELCKEKGIKFVAIRPPSIIGPRDYFAVPAFINNILNGSMVLIKGGKSIQAFGHPWDVAKAHLLALKNAGKFDGEAFHVASFQVSMKDYVHAYCRELGVKPVKRTIPYPIAYLAGAIGEILPIKSDYNRFSVKLLKSWFHLDITKAESQLGFKPDYDFDTTIKDTVEWFKKEQPSSRVK